MTSPKVIDFSAFPDAHGHFGRYGGQFVSETLMAAVSELEQSYARLREDPEFQAEFDHDMAHYVGRPSPLYFAERWSRELGGARIFLKREDLNHTGAHKINNTIGQAALGSTAWPRPRSRRAWVWSAWCTWARTTSSVKP